MPDDGPRHFELENILGKFRLRAKQPAQLTVLAPAAGSRRPTRRRPLGLGSISRGSLLWTAHELAAQRHGRLRWSTSPPGEYRPVPSFNLVIDYRGGQRQKKMIQGDFRCQCPLERSSREIPPKESPWSISALELTSPGPLRPDADDVPPRCNRARRAARRQQRLSDLTRRGPPLREVSAVGRIVTVDVRMVREHA